MYENKIAMFKKAAHNIGVKIQDCLIIEDSVSGITNAYKAGCHNIVVVDSANKKEEYEKLPGVVQVIDSFDNFKWEPFIPEWLFCINKTSNKQKQTNNHYLKPNFNIYV